MQRRGAILARVMPVARPALAVCDAEMRRWGYASGFGQAACREGRRQPWFRAVITNTTDSTSAVLCKVDAYRRTERIARNVVLPVFIVKNPGVMFIGAHHHRNVTWYFDPHDAPTAVAHATRFVAHCRTNGQTSGSSATSSQRGSDVDLSTQPMIDPCHTSGNVTRCGWPLLHLRPGAVVVTWTADYMPGLSIRRPPQGIHLTVTRPGYCRGFGATETVTARLVTPKHEVFLVNACLRAPGIVAEERAVRAMIASAHTA